MIQKYGYLGSIYMLICLIYTKLFFKKAKIIRLPIDIRYKKGINFGKNLITGKNCRIESVYGEKDSIVIGNNVQINDNVHITGMQQVIIKDNVLIASRVYISDCTHGEYRKGEISLPNEIVSERKLKSKPVLIEENVWLGEGVCVLPGVTIGKNSIIGANSVVTKDIPENSIAVGIPAIIIKKFNIANGRWEKIEKNNYFGN
ncbi:MAG: DapH/DapD/GlmU-related protein [Fusobacteriaceae bacterium]